LAARYFYLLLFSSQQGNMKKKLDPRKRMPCQEVVFFPLTLGVEVHPNGRRFPRGWSIVVP
jgi:hypothetical protein